jgi:cytochrome b pre-mRNA-processing protein 3
MFSWLGQRTDEKRKARDLYGAVVAQARDPAFYTAYGVADSTEGRYELVALHLVLALERLGQSDVAAEELRRETLETFITDMDDAMREMGVGDTTVPKRVKRAAAGVYARGVDYRTALAQASNDDLCAKLVEHVYQAQPSPQAADLAAYTRRAVAHLSVCDPARLRAGSITFPSPEAIS